MEKVIVTKEIKTVNLVDVSEQKIYATKFRGDIYKLHRSNKIFTDKAFVFVNLNDSETYLNSTHDSMQDAIRKTNEEVYEFDTQKEFLEWALNNIN